MEASAHMVQFQAARQALAYARTVDEIKEVRDKAEAIRMYLRQAGESLEMQNDAAEIKLRAERRMGQMLRDYSDSGVIGKGKKSVTLTDLGVEENQSRRYQKIASLEEDDFDSFLQSLRDERKEITSAVVLRHASEPKPDPAAWTLTDATIELKKRLRIVLEKWPQSYVETMGHQLVSIGNEILETGELA